jgi:hypothetical protein
MEAMSNAKVVNLGIIHKVLIVFVLLNIIGDIGNVIFWWVSSSSRMSLTPSIIGNAAGADNALIAGTVILLVVSIVYIASLYGLLKKMLWAPLLVIAISIANRVLAVFLYEISIAFVFWAVWTVILVVVSFLDWRKMKALPKQTSA